MPEGRFLTIAEQVAEHLRGEMARGRWGDTLPGLRQLAGELEVNFKTVDAALRQLEKEGMLVPQGAGRPRRIERAEELVPPTLRVAILNYEPLNLIEGYIVELQHLLTAAGHSAFFSDQSLMELGMDVKRIARMVEKSAADAWVVSSGSREVLEWFAAHPVPAFALFGRRSGLPIAGVGPDKATAYAVTTRRLIDLGHRRIVLLARQERRLPEPGASERAFLSEMTSHGLTTGPYNLPDWEESVEGFHAGLTALFRVTPPTAMIVDEVPLFFATQQFLLNRRIQVPQNVSLVCTDGDPHFAWCQPSVAHIHWDSGPVVRRIERWAANVSRGKEDLRQNLIPAEFVAGGTIGPVRK